MKNFLYVLAVFCLVACASKPAPVPEEVAVVEQETIAVAYNLEDIQKLQKNVENARAKALSVQADKKVKPVFDNAQTAYDAALGALGAADFDTAVQSFNTALAGFNDAYNKALALDAAASEEQRQAIAAKQSAEAARAKALSVKANNAAKSVYDPAQALFAQASSAFSKNDFENAMKLYTQCIGGFNSAYDKAFSAREAALKALDNAQNVINEAESELNPPTEGTSVPVAKDAQQNKQPSAQSVAGKTN